MFCVKIHLRDGHDENEEVVRGQVHLFRDVSAILFGDMPDCCSHNLCVIGFPSSLDTFDFLQLTASFAGSLKKLQFIHDESSKDRQIVLLKFDSVDSADTFYRFFKDRPLLLDEAVCHVISAVSVEYTKTLEQACEAPSGLSEIPTCPVCLERLDEHISGIATTGMEDPQAFSPSTSSCLVCRYCMQPDKSTCSMCRTAKNLWVCVICGFVGCGRYQEKHAIEHWEETKHSFSLELESQRVWHYDGDAYVHRIVQSKHDGKLVELTATSNEDCSSCSRAPEQAAVSQKLQVMEKEYDSLMASQFESQRKYYEERLTEIYQVKEEDVAAQADKMVIPKMQKLEQKLRKVEEEYQFLEQLKHCLVENEQTWEKQFRALEEKGNAQLRRRDKQILELEHKVQGLMECLEGGK